MTLAKSGTSVQMTNLTMALPDTVYAYPGVIFGIGSQDIPVLGGNMIAQNMPTGTITAPTTGALSISGLQARATAFQTASATGALSNPIGLFTTPTTGATVTGAVGVFGVPASTAATFATSYVAGTSSDPYTVAVTLSGNVINQPPVAIGGPVLPGKFSSACPATVWNGNYSTNPVEGNVTNGWSGLFGSSSWDPDTGSASSIEMYHWSIGPRASGSMETVEGDGVQIPVGLQLGAYRSDLYIDDTNGAQAIGSCNIDVVDTTPPKVFEPGASFECQSPSGIAASATAASAWLNDVAATDIVDPSVTMMPATVGGVAVSTSSTAPTLFPLGITNVTFSAKDHSGNIGTTVSPLTVVDTTPPTGSLYPSATTLPFDDAMHSVTIKALASDLCGGTKAVLTSISSNIPSRDATDIVASVGSVIGAYGTTFSLAGYTTPGFTRVYWIKIVVYDYSGNATYLSTSISVKG
ncbi:MAG: hypothetical protein ACHREM_10375 [Polyangiales bacterium]